MIGRPPSAGFAWRPQEPAAAGERALPPGDRSEAPEATGIGPREGEGFSETLDRLARELHPKMMAGQAGPAKAMPAAFRKGLQGDARTDAIFEGRDPDAREPGAEG